MFLHCYVDSCHVYLSAGSSVASPSKDVCLGGRFRFPFLYTQPGFTGQMYFTPSKGGARRLIMDNGLAKDPRIKVSGYTAFLTDLTEDDDGNFSVSFGHDDLFHAFQLNVTVCTDPVSKSYGESYNCNIPQKAEFLEFAPHLSDAQPRVLWNRSDPQTNQGGRGQVMHSSWTIISVTQEDNGYYDFREKDRKLLSRKLLTVEGKYIKNDKYAGEELLIRYPSAISAWTVSVKLQGGRKNIFLVNAGALVTESNPDARQFDKRVHLLRDGVKITNLETSDSGTYEFKDPQVNIGLTVQLEVKPVPPVPTVPTKSSSTVYIVCCIAGVIVTVIICCCCVRRCCRKKRSSHRSQAAPNTAAALPVYHHHQNQSSGPSYSVAHAPAQSHQPVNPSISRESAASSSEPPDYFTAITMPQPELVPLGGQGGTEAPSVSTGCLSSEPEPSFELTFPSAPPLSSDSTGANVYVSDKLNFL
ncbi:uncharacterized protein LOC141793607 isoform X3 [Halichoeres trimaculatus]|uniref:uncharacterized protein LOC141793607 isoform X3 n=1 Tax=Halichoeres trimaculatus TaxID=147232 RepID=UPI003D9F7335